MYLVSIYKILQVFIETFLIFKCEIRIFDVLHL
jgi:hypothetical protein